MAATAHLLLHLPLTKPARAPNPANAATVAAVVAVARTDDAVDDVVNAAVKAVANAVSAQNALNVLSAVTNPMHAVANAPKAEAVALPVATDHAKNSATMTPLSQTRSHRPPRPQKANMPSVQHAKVAETADAVAGDAVSAVAPARKNPCRCRTTTSATCRLPHQPRMPWSPLLRSQATNRFKRTQASAVSAVAASARGANARRVPARTVTRMAADLHPPTQQRMRQSIHMRLHRQRQRPTLPR